MIFGPLGTRLSDTCAGALRYGAYLGARYGPSWWLRLSPAPIGVLAWGLSPRQRRALQGRLSWLRGRPVSAWETLPSFVNFAHCLAESLAVERRPAQIEIVGVEPLQRALALGGVVVMTAHTGAWELAASELARGLGRDVVLVMRAEASRAARRVHERVREHTGLRTVYAGEDPLLGLTLQRELERGSIVAFQLDRLASSRRELPTLLFGRSFPLPEGPLRLAASAGVPIATVFCSRAGFLRHRLDVFPLLRLEPRAGVQEMRAVAQAIVASFESFVSREPSQWFDFEAAAPPRRAPVAPRAGS